MHDRRLWSNLGYALLAFMTFALLWHLLSTPPIFSPLGDAFTLYTLNSTGFTYPYQLLDSGDYNRLIDISFNFTIINFVCNETSPLLLVLVHTAPINFAKRKTIRETWGQEVEGVRIVFMVVGSVSSTELQKTLEEENRKYGDFVQGSFLDTYRNITYKHVMALKYTIYHCPQAKYILKTDDDVFVNMPAMINFLRFDLSPYGAGKVLFCTPRRHANVLRSYRSKWRVSFQEYPNRTYPTYCPGWSLLYSPDVIFALYCEAQISEYFWIDDIHITGTLTERISLKHTDIEFLVISLKNLRSIVDFEYNVTQPFLYGRSDLEERQIRALWRYVSTHSVPKYILKDIQY
nr:unnamed protein product [Callosobruchus analis]